MLWIFVIFSYASSSEFPIYIGKIWSQTNPSINFDPETFPICKKSRNHNEKEKKSFIESFAGRSMSNIGLEFQKMINVDNQSLCNRGMSKNNFIDMKTAISQNAYIQFIVNGSFQTSVPIGTVNHSKALYYFSHWSFKVYYYKGNIVYASASTSDPNLLSFDSDLRFTYSVSSIFVTKDAFSRLSDEEVNHWYHYYSLLKISVYMIATIAALGFIIIEKISNDLSDFQTDSQFDDFDESRNQFHWRLLHGDIFRHPKNLNVLSSLVGSSVHLIFSFIVVILISSLTNFVENLGFFNIFLIVYLFSAFLSGFTSINISHQFGEKQYLKSSIGTVLAFSIPFLIVIFLISIITSFSLFTLKNCFLFLLIVIIFIVPFSLFGGHFGSKNYIIDCPCDVAAIPRKQSTLPHLLRNYIIYPIIGSICSFLFIHEFEFMINSFAAGNKKWFLIILATVFFVSIFFISVISVIFIYILLKQQCYWWQWKSFLAPFFSSIFLFIYLLYYLNNFSIFNSRFDLIAAFLASFAGSYLFGLICGGIGFVSANIFIQILFSNLKFS